jgi:hypothetical protein
MLTEMQKRWGVHHIWCNFYGEEHASTCSMCGPNAKDGGLNKHYPQGDKTPDELMKQHFPNNRKVED